MSQVVGQYSTVMLSVTGTHSCSLHYFHLKQSFFHGRSLTKTILGAFHHHVLQRAILNLLYGPSQKVIEHPSHAWVNHCIDKKRSSEQLSLNRFHDITHTTTAPIKLVVNQEGSFHDDSIQLIENIPKEEKWGRVPAFAPCRMFVATKQESEC